MLGLANNKSADQHAHPRSLISAFATRSLESAISELAASKILILQVFSITEQTSFGMTWT